MMQPNRSAPRLSLDELWTGIKPTLDEVMHRGPNDPALVAQTVSNLMGAYTLIFNNCRSPYHARQKELFKRCDTYFSDFCQQLLRNSAQSEDPIHHTLDAFHHYMANVKTLDRQVLNYLNRSLVNLEEQEGRGWFIPSRLDPHHNTRKERKEELKNWGYTEGGSNELWNEARAWAEAACPVDRIVAVASAAHRRFRLDFVEPQIHTEDSSLDGPLAKAIESLLGTEEKKLGQELVKMFKTIGVPPSHPLYIKLNEFAG